MLKKVSVITDGFILRADALSDGEAAMVSLTNVVDDVEGETVEVVASAEELREMIGAMTYILETLVNAME